MRIFLLMVMLCVLLILPGCGSGSTTYCSLFGPIRTVYYASYPDGFLVSGITDSISGNFVFPKRGYTCGQVSVHYGFNFNFSLSASPASVDLLNPPTSGTITGQSFDATYGMPRVSYFDSNGYLVGSVYASSVSGDGTTLQANLPDLSYVYSGNYQIEVVNKTYDGYYLNTVGSATMTASGRDRPDSDGDGWYDDEDCNPYDPYLNYNCSNCNKENVIYEEHEQICPYY